MHRSLHLLPLAALLLATAAAPAHGDEPAEREQRQVDRITITGSAARAARLPGSAQRLTADELDELEGGTGDILRVLMQLPGINVSEEDGYGLRPNIGLRGSGSERSSKITLMEDGVLIAPAPYAAPSAYYFPAMGRMSGLEIRKGSSAVRFGPRTVGGAINVISTPIPGELGGYAEVNYGDDNLRKSHAWVGDSNDRVDWLLEGYLIENNGFKELDGGGDTGFEIADGVAKLRLHSEPGAERYQELEFKAGYTDELSHETYLGLTQADFDADPLRRYAGSQVDRMDSEHWQLQARHYLELDDAWDLTTTLYHNEFARDWYKLDKVGGEGISDILADPATYATEFDYITGAQTSPDGAMAVKHNNREYYAQGVEAVVGWRGEGLGASHQVEAGLRLHRDEEDRLQWSDDYTMQQGGAMVLFAPGSPGEGGGGNNRLGKATAIAGFVQDELRRGRLTLTPGVRFEHIEFTREQFGDGEASRSAGPGSTRENTVDIVIPGLGASWELDPRSFLVAGVHRGFSPPGPGSTEEVEAEDSWNLEAGARHYGGWFAAELIGFLNLYDNLLGANTLSTGGTGTGEQFNGGEATVQGLEAQLQVDPLARRGGEWSLPLSASYTLTQGEFASSFDSEFEPWGSVQDGDELPYLAEHQLALRGAVENPRWRLGVSGIYRSAMRAVAGQGDTPADQEIGSHFLVDVDGHYALRDGLRLRGGVQNVGDEVYVAARRPAGLRPGLPRTAWAGLEVRF